VAAQQAASQEGVSSMELVSENKYQAYKGYDYTDFREAFY
jgi:hypothetical protein